MWTADNRPRYNRDKLRYPSDLTDAEWAHIEPLIPPGKPGGGKRRVAIREVINGVMYILSTGCQWRALPKDLPPRSTVHDYLGLWNWDGTLDRIHRYHPAGNGDPRPRLSGRRKCRRRPCSVCFPFSGNCADSAYQGPVFHRALAGILPDLHGASGPQHTMRPSWRERSKERPVTCVYCGLAGRAVSTNAFPTKTTATPAAATGVQTYPSKTVETASAKIGIRTHMYPVRAAPIRPINVK